MPVDDHPIHPSTQHGPDFRYGCHNQPRPVAGSIMTGAAVYGSQHWTFENSTGCQYDGSHADQNCAGCEHGANP